MKTSLASECFVFLLETQCSWDQPVSSDHVDHVDHVMGLRQSLNRRCGIRVCARFLTAHPRMTLCDFQHLGHQLLPLGKQQQQQWEESSPLSRPLLYS